MTGQTQPITVRLRNGLIAVAKLYQGQPTAKTFANRTQAYVCAERMGIGWAVYGRHPFYVCRKPGGTEDTAPPNTGVPFLR